MALDEPNNDIKIYTVNEIEVMITDDVVPYTEGNMLDFVDDHRGSGFILGPTEPSSSSCCGGSEKSDCSDTGGCCS